MWARWAKGHVGAACRVIAMAEVAATWRVMALALLEVLGEARARAAVWWIALASDRAGASMCSKRVEARFSGLPHTELTGWVRRGGVGQANKRGAHAHPHPCGDGGALGGSARLHRHRLSPCQVFEHPLRHQLGADEAERHAVAWAGGGAHKV